MARIALFDFGNVIARWDVAPRVAEYARRSGLAADEVRERLETDAFWANTDRGAYSGDEMQHRICQLLGCELSRDELWRLQALAFSVDTEVRFLAEAVSLRVPVGLLTNNSPLLREALPRHFPEIVQVFDPILFSFQFGHVKPEVELFEAVQAKLGLAPREILFIDDTPGHVRAAAMVGWDAVRFTSVRELRGQLEARGILG